MEPQPSTEGLSQPKQLLRSLTPSTPSSRRWCIAATSLFLAAVIAVAVAVPVAQSRSSIVDDAGSSNARELAAQQRSAANSRVAAAAGAREAGTRQLQQQLACQGVPGLCKVPVRLVTFPGTHNSNALNTNFASIAEHQKLTFAEQLQAGARLFDIDYAGGRFGVKFGHCMSCLCAFSENENENDPVKVFKTMADFLAANPRDVIVIGLSNINCGDKETARRELLGALGTSPLLNYVSLQPVGANTLLGELVDRNQRALFLFYDEWVTPTGHKVGGKFVPNQALWRIYGGGASVDAQQDPAAIDRQVSEGLLNDVVKQLNAPQPALSPNTPMRIMGLFPSSCLVCRATGVCGPISCAEKANSESFVLFILGKATTRWTRSRSDQNQLVPAFNGFQIDYLQAVPNANVVTAAQKLNTAIAWMYVNQPSVAPRLGLGNCAWVLDDTAAAGGLACVGSGTQKITSLLGLPAGRAASAARAASGRRLQQQLSQELQIEGANSGVIGTASLSNSGRQLAQAGSKRHVLVPANPALVVRLFADGVMRREVKGTGGQVQLLDLASTATDIQVSWV